LYGSSLGETKLAAEIEKRRRVLIVDDERVITDTLVTIFSQSGYEVKGAYSSEQALASLEDWHPDLAIIDVLLPAMNGIDLAIRIKPEWPHCHITLFSGQAATSDLLDLALKNGHTFDVLAKPVHPSELLEMAGRLLGNHLSRLTWGTRCHSQHC
jgi:CheY-like chemotaxis protein